MRPRSRKAHNKVLDAAIELFAVRGIDGTSMDAIAEASGKRPDELKDSKRTRMQVHKELKK